MTESLTARVALVTGASRGIGRAIALALARAGADVAVNYLEREAQAQATAAQIRALGRKAEAFQADVSRTVEVAGLVEQVEHRFGRIDILVNNAGIAVIGPLEDFKLEDFDRTVAVNVRAVFVAAQEAAKHMGEGGRIITIGSTNADRMPFAGGSAYAMSKAAVAGLTRGLARDLGARGITVNNVQPGPVETDMNPADGPFAETLKGFMAIKRYGQGSEIAGMVAYLASPEAAYVTGSSLTIDGGFAA